MATDDSKETDARKLVFAVFALLTVIGVVLSVVALEESKSIPPRIYVFGFLGATVYVFTGLAEKFDEEGQYGLEIACKGIAAFPLAAGVYLLAFAFPVTDDGATAERIISGLVFLSGAYVSLTLRALGSLAHRMLGVSEEEETEEKSDEKRGEAREGRSEGESEAGEGRSEGESEAGEGRSEGESEAGEGRSEGEGEGAEGEKGERMGSEGESEEREGAESEEQNGNAEEEGEQNGADEEGERNGVERNGPGGDEGRDAEDETG